MLYHNPCRIASYALEILSIPLKTEQNLVEIRRKGLEIRRNVVKNEKIL